MRKPDVELGVGWSKPKLVGPIMILLAFVAALIVTFFYFDGRIQEALLVTGGFIAFAVLAVLDMLAALIQAVQNLRSDRETDP